MSKALARPKVPRSAKETTDAAIAFLRALDGPRHSAVTYAFEDQERSDEIARAAWRRIEDAGLDAIAFARAGGEAPGEGHYYAVKGPTFIIEYDKTQDGANHIHSVWRDITRDWGEDLLAAHYRDHH